MPNNIIVPPGGISEASKDAFRDPQDPRKLMASLLAPVSKIRLSCNGEAIDPREVGSPDISSSPGMALGDVLNSVWCESHPDYKLSIELGGALSPLRIAGGPVGEIYLVRNTADGLVLAFPSDGTPWYNRIIHTDDRLILLGTNIPRILAHRAGTVWRYLEHCLASGQLDLDVKVALRLV